MNKVIVIFDDGFTFNAEMEEPWDEIKRDPFINMEVIPFVFVLVVFCNLQIEENIPVGIYPKNKIIIIHT